MSCEVTDFDDQSADKMFDGGIMYGTICFLQIYQSIFLWLFSPFYFIIDQFEKGFSKLIKL